MANHNVSFPIARNNSPGDVTDHMTLVVKNSGGMVVNSGNASADQTTYGPIVLPAGTGYQATLTAYSAQGIPDSSPPSVTFDVNDPPPPPAPGDPTLGQPTIS